MNSSPWCSLRNLPPRLIYCNRGTALRHSARLHLLGWVSTTLLPPPFFSSGRRHRLLLRLLPPPSAAAAGGLAGRGIIVGKNGTFSCSHNVVLIYGRVNGFGLVVSVQPACAPFVRMRHTCMERVGPGGPGEGL